LFDLLRVVTVVDSPATRRPLVRGRFLVFAGIVLVAFGLRSAATAVSPILLTIEEDIPFDAFTVGLLGTLVPFTFAIFGLGWNYILFVGS
jgi:CP family cyanate transporter-like MFS transporter